MKAVKIRSFASLSAQLQSYEELDLASCQNFIHSGVFKHLQRSVLIRFTLALVFVETICILVILQGCSSSCRALTALL